MDKATIIAVDETLPEVFCQFRKADAKKQLVYGMVYAPNIIDQQGDMMDADTLEQMAHEFLRKTDLKEIIDHEHDNWPKDCYPVESWIQKTDDPDGIFIKDSWCLGVKIADAGLWAKVMKGDVNGFSFQGTAAKRKVLVEYEILATIIGVTDPADDGHSHSFVTKMDEDGKPTFGRTSVAPDGHYHDIQRGTATNEAGGHKHRINLKTV